MQLVAYGAQDIYLTGNPQITFFKVVYRRHTNFSMETIEQTLNGVVGTGGNSTVTISRNGDLVYKIYVTGASALLATTNGSGIVSEVELEIGGQKIDKHYEEWNQIWNELSTDESKAIGLKSMIGDIGTSGVAATTGVKMTQYPLNFWFCRNPGLALPLIALQYHEVKLKFKWGSSDTKGVDASIKVMCDYIYLDTDERRRFAQVSHEYLIEQIQQQSFSGASNKLNFNHPVKELIWTSQPSGYTNALLKLNGHDRFSAQNAEYFQLRQPYDYHTAVPAQNLSQAAQRKLLDLSQALLPAQSSMGAAWSATYTMEDTDADDNAVANNDQARAQIVTGGATCLVLGKTGWEMGAAGAVQPFDTQFPAGSEFILVINGLAYRFIKTSTTKTYTAATFPHLGSTPATFLTNAQAETANLIITGTCTNLSDGAVATAVDFQNAAGTVSLFVTAQTTSQARTSQMLKKINVYSFGLKPEEHQPSGTCNFSRIDNAKLDFGGTGTVPTVAENIYAVNYNVLRIMSGMGGLAYSN